MTARWNEELAGLLHELARALDRLAESVAADWSDRQGRDWLDRADRLHRDLLRQADAAAASGGDTSGGALPPLAGSRGGCGPAPRSAVRLGDVAGTRVDDPVGIRIAELPP